MFEVGKKYKRCDKTCSEYVYACLWTNPSGTKAVLQSIGTSGEFFVITPKWYEEYKEPQTVVGYVNIWKDSDGSLRHGGVIYFSEESAKSVERNSMTRLSVVKFEYTEGQS